MGSVHPLLVSRLLRWAREYPEQVHFYFTFKVAPVDRARNQIVDYFLKTKVRNGMPLTHLLFIDSDTIPPEDAIKRLLSHDKDIVTGLTPILRYEEKEGDWDVYDNCFTSVEKDENGKTIKTHIAQRGTGLQEVFRCGGSCLLIKREVFEKLKVPYFRFLSNEDGTSHTRSEDIYFCDSARAANINIYADTEVACRHYKDIML